MKISDLPISILVDDGEGVSYPVSFGFDGLKISDNQKAIVMECIQSGTLAMGVYFCQAN